MPQAIVIQGLASIFWSAAGLLGTPSAAIIDTLTVKPVTVKAEIEGNAGAAEAIVGLDNGFDAEAKCLYDGQLTYPVFMALVNLKLPSQATGATQTAMATSLTAATAYKCTCVEPPIFALDAARKKETFITIKLAYRPDITPA